MQPRIDAEAEALAGMVGDPFCRWLLDEVAGREDVRVGLLGELRHITAVHEHDGDLRGNQGGTRRAGKAGQPGEAFGRSGDIFALIVVSAGYEETIDAEAFQALA